MTSHHHLIATLKSKGLVKDAKVEEVLKSVDRSNFCSHDATADNAQAIGFGVTISAPHMHAIALEALKNHLKPGASALDVGSGCGYFTACLAKMVAPNGIAIGIEHVDALVKTSIENCNKDSSLVSLLDNKVLQFVVSDGRNGHISQAPYDVIHVGAATSKIPDELISQLKPGGRFIGPVEMDGTNQFLMQIDKGRNGAITKTELTAVRYNVLGDINKQLGIV